MSKMALTLASDHQLRERSGSRWRFEVDSFWNFRHNSILATRARNSVICAACPMAILRAQMLVRIVISLRQLVKFVEHES